MQIMNSMAAVAAVAMFCAAQPASASLVSQDFLAAGDGLLTLDTGTNLEWLDLTQTLGLSVADIQAGAGGWISRPNPFSVATIDLVGGLFMDAGITMIDDSYYTANQGPVSSLISLLGCTDCANNFSQGFTLAGVPFDPAQRAGIALLISDATLGRAALHDGVTLNYSSLGTYGVWLYRDVSTVPVPATLPLLASGLAAFGFLGWRRKWTACR